MVLSMTNLSAFMPFVWMSAALFWVSTAISWNFFSLSPFCTQSDLVSRCRILPTPSRWKTPRAALLSKYILRTTLMRKKSRTSL